MNNLLILIVAIILLWLAVTGKLGRVLDAWGVLSGTATVGQSGSSDNAQGSVQNSSGLPQLPTLSFPSLPADGTSVHVGL